MRKRSQIGGTAIQDAELQDLVDRIHEHARAHVMRKDPEAKTSIYADADLVDALRWQPPLRRRFFNLLRERGILEHQITLIPELDPHLGAGVEISFPQLTTGWETH